MCGGGYNKLSWFKSADGRNLRVPPRISVSTSEERERLNNYIVRMYQRNPKETIPLVEIGTPRGGKFRLAEDIDVLLSDDFTKRYKNLLQTDANAAHDLISKEEIERWVKTRVKREK